MVSIVKALASLLLVPMISIADVQYCKINIYDIVNDEKVYNHSSTGKVVDKNNKVGLKIDVDDINHTSGILTIQKERPNDTTYYADFDDAVSIFVMKYVSKNNDRNYMLFDSVNKKSFVFFECNESN